MTTFVLVPGAGGDSWYWSPVVGLLEAAGHEAIAVDLPAEDEDAGLYAYAEVILDAIGDRREVVVAAQSMGAFSAPMAAEHADVAALLLVAPMIPAPGQCLNDWWPATAEGRREAPPFDPWESFFHDVPADLVAEARERGETGQADRPCAEPWPLEGWPRDVATRAIVGRHDRLFPYDFARALCRERVGVEADTIDAGHLPALAKPRELASWMLAVS
jgi:pimeloyl-ACP methyl ester carboxylesterase